MIDIINRAIDWNRLDNDKKDVFKINIKKAQLSEKTGALTLYLEMNFVMSFPEMEKLRVEFTSACSELRAVEFDVTYLPMQEDARSYLPKYLEVLLRENLDTANIANMVLFERTILEDSSIMVPVVGEYAAKVLNDLAKTYCEKKVQDTFGLKVGFDFVCDDEACEERSKLNREKVQIQAKPQTQAKKADEKPKAKKSAAIMGKPIKEPVIEISEVDVQLKNVAIEGIIFGKEVKAIRTGKKILSLLLTDKKTSICVKCFLKDDQLEEVNPQLSEGEKIKVMGTPEWDRFENALVILISSIEKVPNVCRTDNAPKKRVELHAHTKMSAMDGLTPVADLVRIHENWGHSAVAITDHGVVQGFPDAYHALSKGSQMKILYGMEGYVFDDSDCIQEDGSIDYKKKYTNHIILIAKTQEGLKNLYKLVSYSHINYFYKKPRLPKSVIQAHREGLLIGSACEAGEVYRAVLHKLPQDEIKKIIDFYDYLEIQPLTNNNFMLEKGIVESEEDLKRINKEIIELGKKYGKLTCATTDAHYAEPEAAIYRTIVQSTMGYKDEGTSTGLYLRTTEEMLEEFEYLGEELAYEVVVENTNIIAEQVDKILPVPEGKFPPKIPNAEEKLRAACNAKAHEIYGNPLPQEIQERLDAELEPIIREGYAVMYIAAKMLVEYSLNAGYLVGSRGSVGSSFVATMAGITEVNPLPPHYLCKECKHLEWGDENEYDCGVDMPDKHCPKCGSLLQKEGFTIPFQTFLGFEADKEPDIDLNFAGEYQAEAHKYVNEIFGAKNVYKAGTMSTVADKSAYGMVRKYFDEKQIPVNKYEIDRLTKSCAGIKKTTGQHPGGIIIVPDDHEIYEFCPVQRPANDVKSDVITTHYDYHSIDKNLLKLDILGHDVPSIIKHLQDMTKVDPVKDVPLSDEKVNSIFVGTEALNIKIKDYKFTHGSYGIPEFGTKFTRQMLDDTKPSRFADLVRISGFSHGTDVWINNAQEWIKSGKASMKEVISTRDDIMNYLILKGLPKKEAFTIMERVRKGKGLSDEQVELMEGNNIPQWYIESCRRIKYMFPRAHAVAYVMMSYRIAYFKVYHPLEFYAAYFTTKTAGFNTEIIMRGIDSVYGRIKEIMQMEKNATVKDLDELTVLEVAYELYARGFQFEPARLGESEAKRFRVKDGKVQLPFVVLSGLGENAATALAEEYEKAAYETVEEIKQRAKITKVGIETLKVHGVLANMPETDQLSLFEMF